MNMKKTVKLSGLVLSVFLVSPLVSFAKEEAHETKPGSSEAIKDSWAALSEIQAGNKRFFTGKPNHSGQSEEDRNKLAGGQKPPVIVLSCSDSRVPPEKIFDQGLGQIFTVRLAGHVVNSDGIASIEYALEHLGSKVLVVMGHDSCGAVKAALTTPKGKSTGSPNLDGLVTKIRPNVEKFAPLAADDKIFSAPVRANVTATVKDLIKRSKIIREFVEKDQLLIAQGIYHLASGQVDFWNVGQPIIVMGDEGHVKKSHERTPASVSTPKGSDSHHPEEKSKDEAWKKKSEWKKSTTESNSSHGHH